METRTDWEFTRDFGIVRKRIKVARKTAVGFGGQPASLSAVVALEMEVG